MKPIKESVEEPKDVTPKGGTFKIGFPGMRVIKTVIAVYLCFLISLVTDMSPFYSSVAAILCMQNSPEDGYRVGKNRMIGTFIGGIFGFIAALIVDLLNLDLFSHSHYLILSFFLIPLIYTNVYFDTKGSTQISCVVFLSITISHMEDAALVWFVLGRVVNTLIGIVVSIAVNWAMPPPKCST